MNLIAKWNKNRKSKLLSIGEVKKMYPEYRYAVCDMTTRYPVWLCDSIDDARETMEDMWKYSRMIGFIFDLEFNQILKG